MMNPLDDGPCIRVGKYTVTEGAALGTLQIYTRPINSDRRPKRSDFYAWPYYDGFSTGSSPNELNEGDLLAPVLLNVNPAIHGFASLQNLRPTLQSGLAQVRQDVDLADANDAEIEAVAELFAPLGVSGLLGVRGTTLAKVLHRKRPRLIPLYDQHIRAAYTPGRISGDTARSWRDHMKLLMHEMREDLAAPARAWMTLEASMRDFLNLDSPNLTRLRMLDILAWWEGSLASATTKSAPEPEIQ